MSYQEASSSGWLMAMALAAEPEMLILDEPTTGLDVTTQAHILNLLRDIVSEMGTAMMYISHDLGVIARVSDRVALMYAGEIVEDAAVVAEICSASPAHPICARPAGVYSSIIHGWHSQFYAWTTARYLARCQAVHLHAPLWIYQ